MNDQDLQQNNYHWLSKEFINLKQGQKSQTESETPTTQKEQLQLLESTSEYIEVEDQILEKNIQFRDLNLDLLFEAKQSYKQNKLKMLDSIIENDIKEIQQLLNKEENLEIVKLNIKNKQEINEADRQEIKEKLKDRHQELQNVQNVNTYYQNLGLDKYEKSIKENIDSCRRLLQW